jgi:uncharacterized membrane protein
MAESKPNWLGRGVLAVLIVAVGYVMVTSDSGDDQSRYEMCESIAQEIYNERLEEGIKDPSVWQLSYCEL